MSRARRTETLNADFVDGHARDWAFGVHEAFRAPLDISLDTRMDRAANALAKQLGRRLMPGERVMRTVWTQGNPPAYAFSRGQLMHEPAIVHTLPWQEALPLLRRSVMVLDAKPDEGALPEALEEAIRADDEGGDPALGAASTAGARVGTGTAKGQTTRAAATNTSGASAATDQADSDEAAGNGTPLAADDTSNPAPGTSANPAGWVAFALYHYENGQIARREEHRLSQVDFVDLLRYGQTGGLAAAAPGQVSAPDTTH